MKEENIAVPAYDFSSYPSTQPTGGEFPSDANDNDFNDFEEDEMTRRIREEEERIQTSLREKSVLMTLQSKPNGSKKASVKLKDADSSRNSSPERSRRSEKELRRTCAKRRS